LTVCAVALLVSVAPRASQDEAIAYGVDSFSPSNACYPGRTSKDLGFSVAMAEAFDSRFDRWIAQGEWDLSQVYADTAVDDRDWTDVTEEAWGADENDPYGADHADVGMLSSHGSATDASPFYSSFVMGDGDNNTCTVQTNSHMLLGQGGSGSDMEVAILATCQSAQYFVWVHGGYDRVQNLGTALNTWLGFNGDSYDSRRDLNHFENFLSDSYSNDLGDNWLDDLYQSNVATEDGTFEECPAAVIWASSDGKCDDVYYNGGFGDRGKDGGSHLRSCYFFVEGCTPYKGNPLY